MAELDFFQLAQDPKIRTWLDAIAQAEGTTEHGYNTMFGGTKFDDLSVHPNKKVPFTQTDGKENLSSAAGRYQFINPTWQDVSKQLGLTDFSPESQDAAAVFLMQRAGALDDIMAGNDEAAMNKLGSTWASLPSSNYPQPKRSEEEFMAMVNGGKKREPGLLEQAVNMVVPAANAAPADEVANMVLPDAAKAKALANSSDQPVDFGNFDLEAMTNDQINNLIERNVEKDGKALQFLEQPPSQQDMSAAALPLALQAILGPRGAGELRSQQLAQTNPALAQSFSSMNNNLGSMLPLALGASMSNDVGARNMGRSMLPMAMQSMVPTDVGEGLVLPDGTYVTDEPMATTPGAGGSDSQGKGMPVSGTFRIGDIVDMARRLGKAGTEAVTSKEGYGGYGFQVVGDTAKKLNDQFGVDEKFPGGMSTKQMNWWREYQTFINKVRNELYGSALTLTEAQAFEKSVASVASRPETLKLSLKSQFRTILDSLETRRDLLKGAGYNVSEIDKQINELQTNFGVLLEDAPTKNEESESKELESKESADINPDELDAAMTKYGGG